MRASLLFITLASLFSLDTNASAQTLPIPQAVTDPQKISSKPNAQIEPRSLTIEKLYMTRQIGDATWSPDGKSVAFVSNMSGRNNLWLVPADGGFPVQLTVSDQRQSAPAWSPDGKWIAYQSDYNGDELWDIFLVSPKNGKIVNLTQTSEIAELSPTWSPDGRYLAYEVKAKNSAAYEIDVYDMVMREVKHITTGTPQDRGITVPSGRRMESPSSIRRTRRKALIQIFSSLMSRLRRAHCSRRTKESALFGESISRRTASAFW